MLLRLLYSDFWLLSLCALRSALCPLLLSKTTFLCYFCLPATQMSERNGTLKKLEEITYLYEIAKSLSETIDLKKSLYSVLETLSKSLGMRRGTITILNPLRDEIQIQVAHGLSRSAMQRGKYKPGEGITGRVIQQGKPFVVPENKRGAFIPQPHGFPTPDSGRGLLYLRTHQERDSRWLVP